MATEERIKLVVVGDGAVGKTCLLIVYARDEFPEKYCPTVFENYVKVVNKPNSAPICLELWDTAGQEDFDRLRPLSYPDTQIALICFSVVSKRSYDNVKDRWFPEVRHYCPDIPVILVGLKTDLRENPVADQLSGKVETISTEQGAELGRSCGAVNYAEACARLRQGVNELFESAIDIVHNARNATGGGGGRKKGKCALL
ncbi:Rho GTPase [Pelomyxa schiedti]|nr:Rho GTPase [Pelomyxa schiedti]